MLIVNFKTYPESTGDRAAALARVISSVSRDYSDVPVVVAPQATDIPRVCAVDFNLEVWAQSVDAVDPGRHTGAVTPEAVKAAGAVGTFINHSENPLGGFEAIERAVDEALSAGLRTLVFAPNVAGIKALAGLKSDFLAIEPPELISSREVSIASTRPELISEAATIIPQERLLVGAGIHCREDVETSLRLGACGVVVSSDIVKAEDPGGELRELLDGF